MSFIIAEDIVLLFAYETDERDYSRKYDLVEVTLRSGRNAWVYQKPRL